jgi:hypothetical protein
MEPVNAWKHMRKAFKKLMDLAFTFRGLKQGLKLGSQFFIRWDMPRLAVKFYFTEFLGELDAGWKNTRHSGFSHQLHPNLLLQYLLHGEGHGNGVLIDEEALDFSDIDAEGGGFGGAPGIARLVGSIRSCRAMLGAPVLGGLLPCHAGKLPMAAGEGKTLAPFARRGAGLGALEAAFTSLRPLPTQHELQQLSLPTPPDAP